MEMGSDDPVDIVRDRRRDLGDEIVRIRVLRVPESKTYPEGLKYAFHYGKKGGDTPILRYDNHHGDHERHTGDAVEEIEFPGVEALLRRFISELPAEITE